MRALALVLAAPFALAASPAQAICDAAGDDFLARIECTRTAAAAAEAELTALWPAVLASYDFSGDPARTAETRAKLQASQDAWAAWREAECRANSEVPRIPRYWALARLECEHTLTTARIGYLRELYAP